ncbi:MAG TPA: protein translocase subunit SecD, partial [Acidimicrobiales bacterium]|nr:protein translocase subunit SecD [Acidimicrobiales bacterium]
MLVIAVLGGALALVLARPVRLGLDLQGGTQIVLEAQDTARQQVDSDTAARTVEVLRRRVDALGVAEPTLQRSGDRRIIVELPGVADPDQALEVIGRTAQLAFHPVIGVESPLTTTTTTTTTAPVGPGGEAPTTTTPAEAGPEAVPDAGELVLESPEGLPLRLAPARVTGEAVGTARAILGGSFGGEWQVAVEFRGGGSREWTELTGEAACSPPGDPSRRIAIVLDDEIISSPEVAASVPCGVGISGGDTVITGQFTEREAKDLALLIRAGALPVPVTVVEQRTIGPTLGEAAISASVRATVIGATLTILYMLVYYRLLGLLAALALGTYGLISFAVLIGIGATLTLPGIAGFVLAIGMAVDANVLVFERIKEEHATGRSMRASTTAGFKRAWSAIADSNATTLLAALILFFFASGAVRGFGVTLSVGVIVSLFTALVVTRVMVELIANRPALATRSRMLGLQVGERLRQWLTERGPDIVGHGRRWFTISGLLLVVALAGIGVRGLSYGLEFSGGQLVEYGTDRRVDLDRLRTELAALGLPRAVVQESGDGNVSIRIPRLTSEEQAQAREAVARLGGSATQLRSEFVGPTIGDELRRRAFIALGLALAVQLGYLALRFRWTFGSAAVATMFHDVLILLGIFAWLGKELDGVFLAALLTVIGYSINDSVVIFDRIREQRRARIKEPLVKVANDACLQTIPRTVNTGLGALFILVALFALGGETLTDFALALIVGIVVGSYSSVFAAAPLAVALERWKPGRGPIDAPAPPPLRPAAARAGGQRTTTRAGGDRVLADRRAAPEEKGGGDRAGGQRAGGDRAGPRAGGERAPAGRRGQRGGAVPAGDGDAPDEELPAKGDTP